jgi:hypothetical protein
LLNIPYATFFQSLEEKRMNTKLLGAAVAAALLGISTVSFGQAGGSSGASSGSSASGQDTPREAAAAKSTPGSNAASSDGAATSGSTTSNATTGASTTADCSTLTGAAKRRCQRDQNSSSGSSAGVPATKVPDQSGPGTNDKIEPRGKAGVGTSSAGSN